MHLKPKRWISEFLSADRLLVQPHQALAGLQLADVVASAFLQGENSNADNHDTGPACSLRRIMGKDAKGRVAHCGLTLWPLPSQGTITEAARPMLETFGYGFGRQAQVKSEERSVWKGWGRSCRERGRANH